MAFDRVSFQAELAAVQGDGLSKRAAQYRLIDAKTKELDEAHAKSLEPLVKIKGLLQGFFEKFLTDTGQQTAVTPGGTIHWNHRVTASLEDPQAFMDWVIANKRFDMLDRRANATAVKDFAEREHSLPPGAKLNSIRTVGVRKPGEKAKAGA
jgi:hypothetical protein